MNELNLHTLDKHEVEPVQNLIQSAYIHGCAIAKAHKIKWRNSIRTLKKHTKRDIHKPVFFRITLQHKQGQYFSLHLYRRVEHGGESLVGKTVIQDTANLGICDSAMSVIVSRLCAGKMSVHAYLSD